MCRPPYAEDPLCFANVSISTKQTLFTQILLSVPSQNCPRIENENICMLCKCRKHFYSLFNPLHMWDAHYRLQHMCEHNHIERVYDNSLKERIQLNMENGWWRHHTKGYVGIYVYMCL